MLEIFLFHRDALMGQDLRVQIRKKLLENRIPFRLTVYYMETDAIDKIKYSPEEFGLYILDITGGGRGLYMAELIRANSLLSSIIFLSDEKTQREIRMRYRPSGYFCAPLDSCALLDRIFYIYREMKKLNLYFTVRSRQEIFRIPYRNIEYFETQDRKILMHTVKDRLAYEFNAKLDEVEDIVPSQLFVRCHKSCLVNMDAVSSMNKTTHQFVMWSGQTVDISRRMYEETAWKFEKYSIGKKGDHGRERGNRNVDHREGKRVIS